MLAKMDGCPQVVKDLGPDLLADHLGLQSPSKTDIRRKQRRRWKNDSEIFKEILRVIDENGLVSQKGEPRMPTNLELRKLNRYDLLYQIIRIGKYKIAKTLEIGSNSLGRKPIR